MGQLVTKVTNEMGHEMVFTINRSTMEHDFVETKPDICIDFVVAAAFKVPVLK
jgi:hypothetical protein